MCVCERMCKDPTATLSAWSREVNPRGIRQFGLGEWCLGQTSAFCVDAPALESEALRSEHAGLAVQQGVGGRGAGEEVAEAACPPCASCWTLLQPWAGVLCDGP